MTIDPLVVALVLIGVCLALAIVILVLARKIDRDLNP